MEYRKCYHFIPLLDRPAKKRRTDVTGLHRSWPERKQLYRQIWSSKQQEINEGLEDLNVQVLKEVSFYLDDVRYDTSTSKLPAAIVSTGPRSLHSTLIPQISSWLKSSRDRLVVHIKPDDALNLRTALKNIITRTTVKDDIEQNEDDHNVADKTKQRFLNYDLQALQELVAEKGLKQILISVHDVEGINGDVLSDLIDQLGYWRDRIPFVMLMTVATSVGMLELRLSNSARKLLSGKEFEVNSSEEEMGVVLNVCMAQSNKVFMGHAVLQMLVNNHRDMIQDIGSFVASIKYAHMTHFFSNALTIFLDPPTAKKLLKHCPDHIPALRNVPSFQKAIQDMTSTDAAKARELLQNNEQLLLYVRHAISGGVDKLSQICDKLNMITAIQRLLPSVRVTPRAELYIQAMSGKLRDSASLKNLFLALRKAEPEVVRSVVNHWLGEVGERNGLPNGYRHPVIRHIDDMREVRLKHERGEDPFQPQIRPTGDRDWRPTDDHGWNLEDLNNEYLEIVRGFALELEEEIREVLINPNELLFRELFIFNLQTPLKDVFSPKPHQVLERALTTPHDYLGCDCCQGTVHNAENGTMSNTQPPTAILYQLYLESGSLINVHDLWLAFQAIMGEEHDEKQIMALFQRGLSDLKHLGMVKDTRKRVDHVAKTSFKGLA